MNSLVKSLQSPTQSLPNTTVSRANCALTITHGKDVIMRETGASSGTGSYLICAVEGSAYFSRCLNAHYVSLAIVQPDTL
jgi:hypothetical protein